MKKEEECPFIKKEFCTKTLPRIITCVIAKTNINFKICNIYKDATRSGVSLPVPLIELIKEIIKDNPQYRSVADYVTKAVKKEMEIDDFEFSTPEAERDYKNFKKAMDKNMRGDR